MNEEYGFGKKPPYSLYQSPQGKWGLIDGDGGKLPAKFDRLDEDRFSCVPWEVVTFDVQEGFELLAWFDPCEVWFNFIFENPAYPEEFTALMWKKSGRKVAEYSETIYRLIPEQNHWLIDSILDVEKIEDLDDDEYNLAIEAMINARPQITDPAITNPMLDPIMRNESVGLDIKISLWQAKVGLDSLINDYSL